MIYGWSGQDLQNRLCLHHFKTMEELVARALTEESSFNRLSNPSNTASQQQPSILGPPPTDTPSSPSAHQPSSTVQNKPPCQGSKCYNCNEFGHLHSQCPKEKEHALTVTENDPGLKMLSK